MSSYFFSAASLSVIYCISNFFFEEVILYWILSESSASVVYPFILCDRIVQYGLQNNATYCGIMVDLLVPCNQALNKALILGSIFS